MSMVGVILAAGAGVRIHPLSVNVPKPLLPICNKPIMQHQLEAMRAAAIKDVVIVVGALGERVRERFGDGSCLGLHIRYIQDPDPQGIAHSLLLAEPHIASPFVLFLGDIYVDRLDIRFILEAWGEESNVVMVKQEENHALIRRNFAVVAGQDRRVAMVVEKPDDPPSNLKGVGVYMLQPAIFDAIRRTGRSALRGEYELTDSLQTMIAEGHPTYAAEIPSWDANITYPIDLLHTNLRVLRQTGRPYLLGEGVQLCQGVEVSESVLGDGVTVREPISISRSVVLAGVTVDGRDQAIANSIVTSEGELVLEAGSPGSFQ